MDVEGKEAVAVVARRSEKGKVRMLSEARPSGGEWGLSRFGAKRVLITRELSQWSPIDRLA